jgi:hypothetical protein
MFEMTDYPYADIAWILYCHFQFLNDVLLDPTIVATLKRPFVSIGIPVDYFCA